MVITWLYVQKMAPFAYSFGERLGENPFISFNPTAVVKFILYIPIILAIPFFTFSARALKVMQQADPIQEEQKQQDTAKLIQSLRETKVKIQKIKAIWNHRTKDGNKPPILERFKAIYRFLTYKEEDEELEIGIDEKTNEKIKLKFKNVFQHFLIVGPTGSGKTSRVIKPITWQILKHILEGEKMGLTIVEPKGDLIADIAKWCDMLNIPYVRIDPTLGEKSAKFNPLQGDINMAAEGTRAVMRKMFGRQDAFFGLVQEMAARNTILLLKRIRGDNLDLNTVRRALRSQEQMATYVAELERRYGPEDDLVQYFQNEVLGSQKEKFQQFAMGLRLQFEDLMGNETLERVITGNSDIDLDKHLEEGGILLVNTAMGELGKLGDAFGTFIIMHLQNAVFRRPGNEHTRTPHFLLIDEAPRYLNPDLERLLAIGRSFRCACFLALQSLGQLKLEERAGFTQIVMNNCQNKIVFGGVSEEDAITFEREFGKHEVVTIRASYKDILKPQLFPNSLQRSTTLQPRFPYTQIIDLDDFRFIYRLAKGGGLGEPGIGRGILVDPDIDFAPYIKKPSEANEEVYKPKMQEEPIRFKESPDEETQGFTFVLTEDPHSAETPEKETPESFAPENINPETISQDSTSESTTLPEVESEKNQGLKQSEPIASGSDDDLWAI